MSVHKCFTLSCVQWLENDFLKHLHDWEVYAEKQSNGCVKAKNKMMLSRETLEGLHITGELNILMHYIRQLWMMVYLFLGIVKSFVEMTRYLLSQGENIFLLSERVSQDPLENYFGQQRARGGRNENPTVQQCVHNAAAIRVQKSLALNPVRGN